MSAEASPGRHHLTAARATASLLGSEVRLVLGRRRILAVLALVGAVPLVLAVAVRLSALPDTSAGPPLLDRATQNGLFVGVTSALLCVSLLFPLAACLVAGESIAGEAEAGTLRYLLLAPAGRSRLLAVKLAVALFVCALVTALPLVAGSLAGWLLFGARPVPLLSGDTIGVAECLRREVLMAGYLWLSLVGLVCLALFLSTLTDSAVTATAGALVVAVVAQLLGQVPQLDWLHPWLFTDEWFAVGDLLRTPIEWTSFRRTAVLQAGWAAVLLPAAWARFTTADVRS